MKSNLVVILSVAGFMGVAACGQPERFARSVRAELAMKKL